MGAARIGLVYVDVLYEEQVIGTVNILLPTLLININGSSNLVAGTIDASLPLPKTAINGFVENGGILNFALPLSDITLIGQSDSIGAISITNPLLEISLNGYSDVIGKLEIELPLPILNIQISDTNYVIITDAEGNRYKTNSFGLILNTENNGLSEYYNYRFNSFAFFNGQYLGANENGIYVLLGDNDDGSNINAEVKTSLSDYNDSYQKRIHNVVLGIDTDDTMAVSINNEQYQDNKSDLVVSGQVGLGNYKYKANKGMKGRYWSVKVKNVSGADFSLDNIKAMVEILSRTTK